MVAILNLIWVPIVAFADIAIPDKILTLPIIASFVVSLVHFVALYRLRVQVKAGQMLGAMIAAMSRAVDGVARGRPGPDHRASAVRPHLKGGLSRDVDRIPGVLGSRDRRAAAGRRRRAGRARTAPSRCARSTSSPACWCWKACRSCRRSRSRMLENSRINSFAFWRNSAVRAAGTDRPAPVSVPRGAPVAAGAERSSSAKLADWRWTKAASPVSLKNRLL